MHLHSISYLKILIKNSFKFISLQYNIKKKEEVVEQLPQEEPNPLMRKKKTPEELAAEAEAEDLDDFTSKFLSLDLYFCFLFSCILSYLSNLFLKLTHFSFGYLFNYCGMGKKLRNRLNYSFQ